MDRDEFAARRTDDQDATIDALLPYVTDWLSDRESADRRQELAEVAADLYRAAYADAKGAGEAEPDVLLEMADEVLDASTEATEPTTLATWLSTALLNLATGQAADENGLVLEWVTMGDDSVRETHREVDGERRRPGDPFQVCGEEMLFPGQPVGDPACWINCRCSVRATDDTFTEPTSTYGTLSATRGVSMTMTEPEVGTEAPEAEVLATPWFGVLAPEGVTSGDGRMFADESLRNRDLPLPLTWQKASSEGHGGSVTVAKIEKIWRDGNLMKAEGHFLATAEADEVVALIAEFGRYGVSVDADDATAEYSDDETLVFTSARIASASIVSIPAFAEAFVSLGTWADAVPSENDTDDAPCSCDEEDENYREDCDCADEEEMPFRDVSSEERDRLAEEGKALPDGSFPIANCQDLRNAIQAIGRAKDPDEAKAHIRKRKSDLGCEDVELPDTWAAEVVELADLAPGVTEDGPGWLTHPVDTDRLRDYWVHGAGAAKINWGTPGDFNRCRTNLAEYVKPQYLSGYCANRHFDALGYWPGSGPHASAKTFTTTTTNHTEVYVPPLTLTAAAPRKALPSEWFADPHLDAPTALRIEDGRIFGHLATWGTCHIGFDGVCVEPPHTEANYAYFLTGEVETTDGPKPVGSISMGGGHAEANLRWRPAISHYDQTSTVVADVNVGEDEHGIWVAGAIRGGVSEEEITTLAASGGLSGDWREIGGNLELVAALAVNVPGFPVPRVKVAASNGRQVSLVAAGVVAEHRPDVTELAREVAAVVKEQLRAEKRQEELRVQLLGERLAFLKERIGG